MPTDTQSPIDTHSRFALIGEAVALLAQSDLYGRRSLQDVGGLLLPPLALGQIRLWRRGGHLVGLASWAWLDAATEEAVLAGDHPLAPQDWQCGDHPVVMDFAAPFGGGFAMGRDLLREVFPDRAVRAVRRDASGRAKRIVQFPGRDAAGQPQHSAARAA
ncbi:MAG: toxin-activating lysine-acyltransferase [Rhodobacteraceae bacterium]|nr:toxin-activating lysine-acyltransferase [Paracoccaceae bacterium]